MIYKYTSTYDIFNKIYRDNDYADELPWEDCIEWIAEALDKIGAYPQYIRRITGDLSNPCLDILDYKAKLPCDVFSVEQVAVNGVRARYAGNTFHHIQGGDCCTIPNFPPEFEDLFKDNFNNEFTNLGAIIGNATQEPTYDINDNFITLNVQTAKVCLAYLAKPIDKNGWPLIPDDVTFKEAMAKYCTMKLDYREWRKGRIAKDVFQYSEREWLWACGAAKARALQPNLDKMENLKKRWIKLLPEIDQSKIFFK